jgi:membrane fusion protein
MLGEFSEKYIVNGYLESTKGEARVFPSKNGILIKKYISHGEEVKKGDKLFLIDTSYENSNKHEKSEILLQLEKKKKSLDKELLYKKNHLASLKQLLIKKYISQSAYHQIQEEIDLIKSNKSNIELDILKYQKEQSYVVYAPIDGIISSVIYENGQYINLTKPLAKIIPTNADLTALIYVPVKQSGFLENKSNLIIRFDAYPYPRFGTVNANIYEISQSILTDLDEDKPIKVGGPYYKVKAKLDNQFISLYGQEKKIQHGMTISAVIIGAKRKIWQWILDPIYSFYGGVFL